MKSFLIVVIALSMAPLVSATVVLASYPQVSSAAFSLNGTPPINDAAGFTMGTTGFDLASARVQFSANGIAPAPRFWGPRFWCDGAASTFKQTSTASPFRTAQSSSRR